MSTIVNETQVNLLKEIGVSEEYSNPALDLISDTEYKYLKDLKINVSNFLAAKTLSKKEVYLIALAVAVNEKNQVLKNAFVELAKKENTTDGEFAELYSCVSLLNVNNVFYRFRHFTKKEYYETTPAGIKMSIMMSPILGKEFFELLSLVVSSLNGCELCVTSHEESLIKIGTSEARIYDAIRLGAVIKGLSVVVY